MKESLIRRFGRSLRIILASGLILGWAGSAVSQMLDSLDKVLVDSSLKLLRLRPDELGFDKLWAEDDTFRLDVVEKYLKAPLEFPSYVDSTITVVDSSSHRLLTLLNHIDNQLQVDIRSRRKNAANPALTYDASDPFRIWSLALQSAEPLRKQFYEDLDSLDLMDLMMAAPTLWIGDGDSAAAKLRGSWQQAAGKPIDTSRTVDQDRLLDIIKKLDVHSLIAAGKIVLPAAQLLADGVAANPPAGEPIPGKVKGVFGDVLLYRQTEWGVFVIGGTGDNTYEGDFAAIIDLGGDDVYRGRVAGAMGELGNQYALVIDLKGNDYYDAEDLGVTHGAGFLGIGVLIDNEGNDVYRSSAYAQGAGLFGIGLLADYAGIDDMRGEYFVEGAGHCGVGVCINEGSGDDRYLGTVWAQGFAGTYGYGLIYDNGGDDNYRCGGVYLHAPLLPNDNQSFSGGFGMGWRPRAGGGIGVQIDEGQGVDYYDAEVMSFGSSYWYSIGILYDDGGNDRYSLAHYGMGSGIHLSLGAFFDKAGDDQYRSRMGVVGGTPHDLSVGIFVDGAGDDSYGTCDGWGGSLTNSFGMFIDRLGNDTYFPRSGGCSLGNVRWARGFGGAAIFLDEEGDDMYPPGEPAADSSMWIQSGWGIGMDLARDVPSSRGEEPIPEPVLTAEDSAKSIEDLFAQASQWEVGNAIESTRRGRKALMTKGAAAAVWAIEHKLDSQNSLERIPLEQLIKAYPDTSGPLLIKKLDVKNGRFILSTAAAMLGTIKWKPAVEPLLDMLDEKEAEKSFNSIIGSLGEISDKKATARLIKFVKDEKERRRMATLGALKSLKDTTSIQAIVETLGDRVFTVRSSAWDAAVGFGPSAVGELVDYTSDQKNSGAELAVNALGKIAQMLEDSTQSELKALRYRIINHIEELTESDNRMIRAEAVAALYRNSGENGRIEIAAQMEYEYDPVVLAAYARVKREVK